MSQSPLVISIILNTNRRDDTLECLQSLADNDYPNQQVIVLDNNSLDGSGEAIRNKFPKTNLISLTKNLGYAGNNNVGIQAAIEAQADWIFVLNEDIILAKDAISQLINIALHDRSIGILGPMVYHYDEPQVIQSAGGILDRYWRSYHRGQNEPDHGQFDQVQEVDWISGCAIMVRRDAVNQAGPIDERFFYYWEETEWCVRIRKHGWRAIFAPQAKIWHKGVQPNYQPGPNVTYYATRNRLLLLACHHAPLNVWLAAYTSTIRTLLSWSMQAKWRQKIDHRNALWQGFLDFHRARWGMRQ